MLQTGKEVAEIAGLFYSDIPVVLALPVGVAIIIIMFIYYYFNPQGWKKLYAYIVLFMAVFTAWLLMSSNVLEMLWGWQDINYYGLRLMAYFLPITANLVIYELLKERSYAHMGWVLAAYSLLGTLAIGGQLMGYETLDGCMSYYYPLLGIGETLAIYWCIKAAREGDILCKAVAPSAIAYTLLGLFDGFSDILQLILCINMELGCGWGGEETHGILLKKLPGRGCIGALSVLCVKGFIEELSCQIS
jgi:hypothetical protein